MTALNSLSAIRCRSGRSRSAARLLRIGQERLWPSFVHAASQRVEETMNLRRVLTVTFLMIGISPCLADWSITKAHDAPSNKDYTVATVKDATGTATLDIYCVNGRDKGSIGFSKIVGFGEIGASFRFDDA